MSNRRRILLVEDLSTDAALIEREVRKVLPESEFRCVETRSDFLTALESWQPDLILSDYRLPQFDGMSALRLALECVPETPFIIVTGSMNEDTAVECMKTGAWDYVIKEHLRRIGPAVQNALEQQALREQRRRALRALRESEERYRCLLEMAPVGIAVHSEGRIVFINPAGLSLLGADSPSQVIGLPVSEIIHPNGLEVARARLQRLEAGESGLYPAEDVYLRLDGTPIDVEVMASLFTFNGRPAIQAIVTDITARKRAEADLRYLSYHDYLTDLHNRRYFEEELRRLDVPESLPLTLVMGDVNGLKLINDSFGHEAGDELLRKVSRIILAGCTACAAVARIGGDEFAILLPRTDETQAEQIITQIKQLGQDATRQEELLSVSFGFSTKHHPTEKLSEVLAEAENQMYKRKMYESASMRNRAIDVIMGALFEKSARELMHSRRVSKISAALATELGFDSDEVNKIRISGLLHDIGKIGIDETILNKPGRLSEAEWGEIRKHPEAGWRILAAANEFLDLARHVLSHHERWDGSGYPSGLAGEEIPIEARIIAVADAYDAMTSQRSYSNPASSEQAIAELRRCSGRQFDPRVVAVFLDRLLPSHRELASG